ncbi:MAG: hypothetical protein QMC23_11900 [Rubritalea sp.]|jgi:hypothetical protein|tara:strand:- start:16825 stop:18483 length:1659 start_codon:yes stop_codon:yes gene_type:complete
MDPELEILEASFNNRIEQWLSKQGLLFQFMHNTGSVSITPKIIRLVLRLVTLAIIGVVILWFYLISRPNSEAYKVDVQQQLAIGLNAGEVEISDITRDKGGVLNGEMLFSMLTLGETKSSFFEDWYVMEKDVSVVGRRSVTKAKKMANFQGVQLSPLGIGDNYFSGWSGKELNILKMELKLKTGADTDEIAMAAYSSLFKQYETLNIDTIQVFDATLLWGDTESSAGSIKGAGLNIVRGEGSWEIDIIGGTFSHSWLKDAAINHMKVICKSSGEVVIESASFKLGAGELKLNASIQVKSQPELTGNYSFDDVEVIDLIGESYEEWLGGTIDGSGVLSGKFNSVEGIKVATTVKLNGNSRSMSGIDKGLKFNGEKKASSLIIRGDRFQLLKILQMKDLRNSYSLLGAHKGTLIIENQGTDTHVTVENMNCGLNDLIIMNGKFKYAVDSAKSPQQAIDVSSSKRKDNEINPLADHPKNIVAEKIVDRIGAFSGEIVLGLTPGVFEGNTNVFDVYPIDSTTLRVWLNIKLSGQLEELTVELADKLYDLMEQDENN